MPDRRRLEQFDRAVNGLDESLGEKKTVITRNSSILCFILAYELAWKALKGELERGGKEIKSPREALREGFHEGLIGDDPLWIKTLSLRNEATHTYAEPLAEELYGVLPDVLRLYKDLLKRLKSREASFPY
jgi:nucleotidyltransferase substrate binding protein (TIGR01987 family)